MKKRKILFIINPISGDIKKSNLANLIPKHLDLNQFEWEIANTERAGHATHIAKEALTQNIDIIVAVGGDGSINEIAKSIINSNIILAFIPLGSGNGLAFHLQLPIKNIKKALEIINTGKIIRIDTLKSNKGPIIAFAGTGFEAITARTYRHLGKRGFLAYTWATIKTVFNYKAQELTFTIDNISYTNTAYMFSIYNSKYLGYKVGKLKEASLKDGFFRVVVVNKFPFYKMLWMPLLELIGKMKWSKHTQVYKAKKISIQILNKKDIQIDGDSFITSSNFEIEINPLSLKIIVPQELENY